MFADYVVESSEVTTGITRIGLSLAFYTVAFAVKIILQSGALDWTNGINLLQMLAGGEAGNWLWSYLLHFGERLQGRG